MTQDQSIVRTAKTVDGAIELALLELGVGRDEVEVDVVSGGRSGILGIGAEDAKVRVTPLAGAGTGASAGLAVVSRFLDLLDVDARSTIRSPGTGPDDPPVIEVEGEDAGLIIGRRGDTLRALQFLTNVVLGRQQEEPTPVIVDVEQYRERRFAHLRQLATRTAERAIASGRPVTLEPMSPADRRMVHITLADNKGVTTESSGEGSERRVTIEPTGTVAPSSQGSPTRAGGRRGRRPAQAQPERDEPQTDDGPQFDDDDEPQPGAEPQLDADDDDDEPQPGNEPQLDAEEDNDDDDNGPQLGNERLVVADDDDDDDDDDEPQPGNELRLDEYDDDDDDEPQPGNR